MVKEIRNRLTKDGTTFHVDMSEPRDGEMFVYGSNLAGIHGAGAARYAHECMGAEWGKGRGFTGGLTYGIATKDRNIKTLPLEFIEKEIETFKLYTETHPGFRFFVTRVGCGLAGFADGEIAPLFKGAKNCSFPLEWKEFLVD